MTMTSATVSSDGSSAVPLDGGTVGIDASGDGRPLPRSVASLSTSSGVIGTLERLGFASGCPDRIKVFPGRFHPIGDHFHSIADHMKVLAGRFYPTAGT